MYVGKTIENMRLRFDLELVSCPRRMRKLINRPTFKYCTTYSENLSVVVQHSKEVDFCKPIYVGFTVLELSKVLMYGFHYDVMKRHYGDRIELLYTDTGAYTIYADLNKYIYYYCMCFRFTILPCDD